MDQKLTIFACFQDPDSLKCRYISASRKKIKNRLDVSANLAIWNMHAKYQLIRAIHSAGAVGVVRNSPQHLIIGGCLYFLYWL